MSIIALNHALNEALTHCTSKRFDSPADSPLHSAATGEQPLAFIIHEPVGELGAARRASVGVIDAIHFR